MRKSTLTSSDDIMIDLQIEESLSRETLMAIDSSNRKEDYWTFGFFVTVIICAFLVGLYGPPLMRTLTSDYSFLKGDTTAKFSLDSVSAWNHFIDCDITYLRSDGITSVDYETDITVKIMKYKRGILIENQELDHNAVAISFEEGESESNSIHVLADRLISYDKLVMTVSCKQKIKAKGLRVTWTYGDPDEPLLQIGFRVIFSLSCLLALIFLVMRLWGTSFKIWHLEQKLTVFLLVVAFLANDPLYFIQALEVTKSGVLYDVISSSLFRVYLLFFMLTLFDSLRYKNRKIGSCFLAPKYLFMAASLVIECAHSFVEHSQVYIFAEMVSNGSRTLLRVLQWFVTLLYMIWMLSSIMKAGYSIDVTERYKFTVYSIVSLFSVVVLVIFQVLDQTNAVINTSLGFTMKFAIQNCFVLLMAVFHWPYELLTDSQYRGTGDGEVQNDFFTNEE